MNPLERLYKTKLALFATLLTCVGLALLFMARWVTIGGPTWLQFLPLTEIGSTLFVGGLLSVGLTYLDQRDAETRNTERFRRAIAEEASTLRDAVFDGFAFKADDIARVASPATLDQITQNALSLQLGDRQLAEDVYADIKEQVIRSGERWYDLDISVTLSPWEHGPAFGTGAMFVATVRREYRVTLTSPIMRFACVSDLDEYRELLQDPSSATAWYFQPVAGLSGASDEAFELVQFTVDGKARSIRRTKRAKAQVFSVHAGSSSANEPREVTISYTYRVLVQRNGHLLWLDVAKPTKGLKVEFRYGDCSIRHVSVVDFIASAQPTRITTAPKSIPAPSVELGFDGWVFPKSGVGFVWVLDAEMVVDRRHIAPAKSGG